MRYLTNPIFTDADKAREHLEAIRWASGSVSCPHCGETERIGPGNWQKHRPGLYYCLRLQEAIHGDGWNAVRALAYPAKQVDGRLST